MKNYRIFVPLSKNIQKPISLSRTKYPSLSKFFDDTETFKNMFDVLLD